MSQFFWLTCLNASGAEEKVIISSGHIAMVSACPDKQHGSHVYLPTGMLTVKETLNEVARCLPPVQEVPQGAVQ